MHLLAHREHFRAELDAVAALAEELAADLLEGGADGRIAGDEAGAGQRLVLPHPGVFELVLAEGFQRTDDEAGVAVRPQPQVGLEQDAGGGARRQPGVEARAELGIDGASLRRRIVEQVDEIEVGSVAEFLAAKLAIADHREGRLFAVPGEQFAPGQLDAAPDEDVGEFREVVGELLHGEQPGDVLCEEAEHLRMVRLAQHVHLLFGVGLEGVGLLGELLAEARPVGRHLQDARIEQFVEQDRVAQQVVGRPGRGAGDLRDLFERLRILQQQREIGGAAADRFEQVEHARQRLVRIGHRRRRLDDARHEGVEARPGLLAHLLVAQAAADRAKPRAEGCRRAKAESDELLAVAAITAAGPDLFERLVACVGIGENPLEMAGDGLAMVVELHQQRFVVREAHRPRDALLVVRVFRQRMRLGIVEILEAVFEAAQETVGAGEGDHVFKFELAAIDEPLEHFERRLDLQGGIAAAADQLERLRDELDLADAAGTELDVVRHVLPGDLAANLRMQVAHRVDRAEVEILAEHEGGADLLQLRPAVSGQGARLDPGVAFPLAALRVEVVLQHVERAGQRPGVAVGAQPHVDAEHLPVAGDVGQRVDQALAEAREEFEVGDRAAPIGVAVLGIDEDQVDVRRDVQLAAAELAHADDDEALACARRVARHAVAGDQRGFGDLQRGGDGGIGDQRHALDDLGQVGPSREVAAGDARHGALLETAQRRLELVFGERRFPEPGLQHGRIERRCGAEFVLQLGAGLQQALEVTGVFGRPAWMLREGHGLEFVSHRTVTF